MCCEEKIHQDTLYLQMKFSKNKLKKIKCQLPVSISWLAHLFCTSCGQEKVLDYDFPLGDFRYDIHNFVIQNVTK